MFTEGLDESAIKWIKQGSDVEQVRSPLTEKLACSPFPESPLMHNTSSHMSPHVLPPLKFHSGLLAPHSVLAFSMYDGDNNGSNDDCDYDDDDDDDDSMVLAADELDGNCQVLFEEEGYRSHDIDFSGSRVVDCYDKDDCGLENITKLNRSAATRSECHHEPSINRGLSKENLRIQVPDNLMRFKDGKLGVRQYAQKNSNSVRTMQPPIQVFKCTSTLDSKLKDAVVVDLGTPSAPPVVDIEEEGSRSGVESEEGIFTSGEKKDLAERIKDLADWRTHCEKSTELEERRDKTISGEREPQITYRQTNSVDHSPHYDTSDQSAWQTLIAYDACVRLCLHAWARDCMEAPEFLRDECLLLRSAFGLHKFLLQPQGVRTTEGGNLRNAEQISLKAKKVVGKIRVEVKKLRIIPRRKLKSTYSQRGAIYMQAGAQYIQHVSSAVKMGINSLRLNSFLEEPQSCLFQLKSSSEDTKIEHGSTVCLHAGTGEYHVFFPESQGDALLVEVQDSKKCVQGRTTIPISSLTENFSDKIQWWPIYHDDQECVGKVQLSIGSAITFDKTNHIKSSSVVETLAYDFLLEAAMRAQRFHSRNLWLHGPWKWLMIEFSDYYGVSDSYTKLRYLTHVMNVATPTKDCLELVYELLVPVIKARSEKSLTRQERSILLDCEAQVESLLANVFENYKALDENSLTGLSDLFGPTSESAAPAIAPAVQVFSLLHDILAQDAQKMLRNYFQMAAIKRCKMHMVETDEFMSGNSEDLLADPITISTAYLKMKKLYVNISNELQADIKIHNQHILPSSIDLSNIAATVYSTELGNRLRGFLAAWPPSSPLAHVNELLIAASDFERDLESWNISPVQGGLDSRNLFHNYILVWVQDMQLKFLDLCKAEKVPWSGVTTNHSTSPFAEELYEKIKDTLVRYEVVINRWPQYSLILENAVANVERAIIKALEKQYNDILTPLKDSIPKRLNVHVQKLTRRQSTALYSVPNQLGTFVNTIKRILDVLHCRVEDFLKSWASCLSPNGDKKSLFGEQMNGITVLLRTKYKIYVQATIDKLISNMQANRSTRLKRILEETKEEDTEAEVYERIQILCSQLIDSISNLHEVFTSQIFIAICRGFWDRMGQTVLKFLEGRKENRIWYKGSYYALGILDDTFAAQMQRLQGNALQEKDVEPPRSVIEARSILCRDTTNATDPSTYLYF